MCNGEFKCRASERHSKLEHVTFARIPTVLVQKGDIFRIQPKYVCTYILPGHIALTTELVTAWIGIRYL